MRALHQARPAFHTGANKGTRTLDLLFTKQLLYQLSYVGTRNGKQSLVTAPYEG